MTATGERTPSPAALSPQVEALRERALGWLPERRFGWLRDCLYLEGWMAAEGQPLPLRNAEALAHVVESMPVWLEEGDLLAGEHGGDPELVNLRARQPGDYAERVAGWPIEPERRERALGWLRAEPFGWQELAPVSPMPPELERLQRAGVVSVWGTELNHSIRGYEKVLRLGFRGLAAEIDRELARLLPDDPDAPRKRCNLLAFRRLCDAACTLGRRHAAAARERALHAVSDADRAAWTETAHVCARVPEWPARSLREAVQALWFAHMITVWEDGVNANGIGRIDQFLLRYWQAAGPEERERAFDVLAALWCKLYQPYDVQQIMVGGQRPDGADAVNDLSYLVLDVTEALGFVRCLSARLHRGASWSAA
ncbi:MAG TPA: pyruvate formate lyase family protein [Chthonomonadales bacterium]|nr:pyruvate formate lyase family protein [Chthonomonadales bacterium]